MTIDPHKKEKLALQRTITNAQKKLDIIEAKEREDASRPYIGKCYRTINSYGGHKPSEQWWMYFQVLEIHEHGFVIFKFQKDCTGIVIVNPSHKSFINFDDCEPVSYLDFIKEWDKIVKEITQMRTKVFFADCVSSPTK